MTFVLSAHHGNPLQDCQVYSYLSSELMRATTQVGVNRCQRFFLLVDLAAL